MNLWLIFLTGLTSGGVTCAAMQGGLLASTIANQKKSKSIEGLGVDDWAPVTAFLTTKLIAHMILGALLGWLGSRVELSLSVKLFFQILAALFMLATAFNLLELHPIFRYLAIQPPKFVYKWLKHTTLSSSLFAPALFGVLTILIPCGVTQAMEVIAITSGSPVIGALTMGVFILGTAPVFALIGLATARLSESWRSSFLHAAAILLIFMSLYSVNGVLKVLDSPYSLDRLGPQIVQWLPPYDSTPKSTATDPNVKLENGTQKVTLSVSNGGYSPKYFRVKNNVPVELTLETTGNVYSCATAFTFKAFDIKDFLKPSDSKVHTFTPTKKGLYTFACSMGMYSGTMEVI